MQLTPHTTARILTPMSKVRYISVRVTPEKYERLRQESVRLTRSVGGSHSPASVVKTLIEKWGER